MLGDFSQALNLPETNECSPKKGAISQGKVSLPEINPSLEKAILKMIFRTSKGEILCVRSLEGLSSRDFFRGHSLVFGEVTVTQKWNLFCQEFLPQSVSRFRSRFWGPGIFMFNPKAFIQMGIGMKKFIYHFSITKSKWPSKWTNIKTGKVMDFSPGKKEVNSIYRLGGKGKPHDMFFSDRGSWQNGIKILLLNKDLVQNNKFGQWHRNTSQFSRFAWIFLIKSQFSPEFVKHGTSTHLSVCWQLGM